ncbi:hypothetical protein BKA83DRAFT_4123789 [Pisolithus microcarpus]|nr:hypothetical protein BKA83DRAFT_4123789 [Pisolithus microcarpus]
MASSHLSGPQPWKAPTAGCEEDNITVQGRLDDQQMLNFIVSSSLWSTASYNADIATFTNCLERFLTYNRLVEGRLNLRFMAEIRAVAPHFESVSNSGKQRLKKDGADAPARSKKVQPGWPYGTIGDLNWTRTSEKLECWQAEQWTRGRSCLTGMRPWTEQRRVKEFSIDLAVPSDFSNMLQDMFLYVPFATTEDYVPWLKTRVEKTTRVAAEVERKSEEAIHDKAGTLRRGTEVTRGVERAKRRQQTIQTECGTSRIVVFCSERNRPDSGAGKEAIQNTINITETVRVAQATVDKTVREAAESARAAREALEEAEECLGKGIQPIVVPTSEKVVAEKTRVQYEPGCLHFAVAGSGKSWFVNAIRGVDTQHQRPPLSIFRPEPRFAIRMVPNLPTYIVRSKADVHIRNMVNKDGYDSDRDDATVRESLFPSARG